MLDVKVTALRCHEPRVYRSQTLVSSQHRAVTQLQDLSERSLAVKGNTLGSNVGRDTSKSLETDLPSPEPSVCIGTMCVRDSNAHHSLPAG